MLVLENDAMFAAYGVSRTIASPQGSAPWSAAGGGDADAVRLSLLAALGSGSGGSGTGNLKALGDSSSNGLNLGTSGGGPIAPGRGGLADIRGNGNAPTGGPDNTPRVVGNVSGGVASSAPIANAEAVVRRGLFPRARACYNRSLQQDPSQQGKVVVSIRVGPSGEVASATAAQCNGLSASMCACVAAAARNLMFEPPSGGTVTLTVPMNFVSQGGGTVPPPPPPPVQQYEAPAGPTAFTRASDDAWRSAGDDAIAKLRATSEASPQSRMKREALVRGLLSRGRFDQALTLAKAFVEADPDLPVARELLSYAAIAAGDTKTALLAVDAGVETSATTVKAHLRAARAFESAQDERRACAHWRSLAELSSSEEWRYEALRCRARALGDRDGVLAEIASIEKPGKLLEKLKALAPSDRVPAYDPQSYAMGQMEVALTCAAGVKDCPLPIVVAPNGVVFSPYTPADARSSARAVAVTALRDGAYHTMIVGGSDDAKGEIVIRVAGVTQKMAFAKGGLQSIAVSDVTLPAPGWGIGGGLAQLVW